MSWRRVIERPGTLPGEPPRGAGGSWQGLKTLIRARLLIASVALAVGVGLSPDRSESSWWVLWWSLLAVVVLSALFWLGARLRRGLRVQTYLQLGADLVLVTLLSALTGGRDSQFMLLFALVVITGGLIGRVTGGLFTVAGAWLAVLGLPWLTRTLGAPPSTSVEPMLPRPHMLVAFLAIVGVLSGILGERVRRAREDLEQTTRELDRVRLDNDVILRHLTTGVLTVNSEGRIAYLNPAAEQMLGLRTLEVRGKPIHTALPERLHLLRDVVRDSCERRAPRARAELMMVNALGRPLPVGVSTNMLTHEGHVTGVVAVFQDLTEVREMEHRARRNQTLAEVGALAAGVAHELRNGLNPISGSVECLQRELKLEGENAVLMELIATECSRLNRFVTDLLTYSRERDLALEPIELNEHLAELCEVVARDPRCGRGVTVRFERGGSAGGSGSTPRVSAIVADREQIRQVWLNLSANALEAMKQKGTLVVRWRETEHRHLAVEFVDDGPGIAAEHLPRVGEPFFTTKEGGTGLGVAIAQRIVERHGGTLSFDSAPGRGTIARVILPAAQSAVALVA